MLCFSLPPSLSCGKAADALRAELIQKCIFASELFTYRCMIMIPRLIRDKRRCCLLSWCTEGNLFFSCWPLPRQRPHFTANTLIDADTWAMFFFLQPVIQESCKTAHWEQMPYLRPHLRHQSPGLKHKVFLLLQHQIPNKFSLYKHKTIFASFWCV